MLEVKNLKKTYKTKGGVQVHALDDVSIRFPETGMVFLLGKSGSGKSTLLNVSGGLDKPDEGEVIVKGKSSKDFTQSDFDSYRNTYVGFVFQEYNILSEFNVETNIGLALELQGKKNDKQAVENILRQVDLEGLGKRKPNTLSGGQKQRIAIARALIKEPEIIMADEPTGALDSNTGKQVLDTLKKLSKTKLVIVVSHDQDFAEHYGDRIIELKDGKVLTDISKTVQQSKEVSKNVVEISENTFQIKNASELSKEDFENLYKKIKESRNEVIISSEKQNVNAFKKTIRIDEKGHQEIFKNTKQSEINIKEYGPGDAKFIKSKLPMKHAFKMGASNLKIKPFRLAFTMFLSIVAFTLFGVLSTLMLYNASYTYSEALQKSDLESLVVSKYYDAEMEYYRVDGEGNSEYIESWETCYSANISKDDVNNLSINNNLGLDFAGIYATKLSFGSNLYSVGNLAYYSNNKFNGLTDCGEDFLLDQGFTKICGTYPANENEIAISRFTYETFKNAGYYDLTTRTRVDIKNPSDLIEKTISTKIAAGGWYSGRSKDVELKITAIYETDEYALDSKYDILKEEDQSSVSEKEIENIQSSFDTLYSSSYYSLGYVAPEFYNAYSKIIRASDSFDRIYIESTSFFGCNFMDPWDYYSYLQVAEFNPGNIDNYYPYDEWSSFEGFTITDVENYNNLFSYVDIDGNVIEGVPTIANDEAYLNFDYEYYLLNDAVSLLVDQLPGSLENECYATGKTELMNSLARYINYTSQFNAFPSEYITLPIDDVDGEFNASDLRNILLAYNDFLARYDSLSNSVLNDLTCAMTTHKPKQLHTYKVKGFMIPSKTCSCYAQVLFNNAQKDKIVLPSNYWTDEYTWKTIISTNYEVDKTAQYDYAICKTDKTMQELDFLLQDYEDDSYYLIVNPIFDAISLIVSLMNTLKTVFLITGVVNAIFSGLMLLNFISTSISTKEKEIGILRAVGARGSDVFKIYFSEAGLIGAICFVTSVIITSIACISLNAELTVGLNISLFNFGPLNMLFVLGVAAVVCFAGTIFPVTRASRRPPVESIRAL